MDLPWWYWLLAAIGTLVSLALWFIFWLENSSSPSYTTIKLTLNDEERRRVLREKGAIALYRFIKPGK